MTHVRAFRDLWEASHVPRVVVFEERLPFAGMQSLDHPLAPLEDRESSAFLGLLETATQNQDDAI